MALPTKLSSADVKGWARNKGKQVAKAAVRAAKKAGAKPGAKTAVAPVSANGPADPGKAKAPADDPTKTQQKPDTKVPNQTAGNAPPRTQPAADGVPNTEPADPMNAGGPGVPQEFLDDMRDPTADGDGLGEEALGYDPEIEEKLGDFAEVLEHRADELEELAGEVEGDLTDEDLDVDTMREVQSVVPDDIKQDLVEHLSALSDDEIMEFCQYLKEQGRIEDPELVAGFLRAAAGDSRDGDDSEDDDADSEAEEDDDSDEEEDEKDPKDPKAKKKGKKKGSGKDDEEEDDDGESDTESDEDE